MLGTTDFRSIRWVFGVDGAAGGGEEDEEEYGEGARDGPSWIGSKLSWICRLLIGLWRCA